MIAVLFTAGNFGSTIEYCLRQFSQELAKVDAEVLPDGSMHGFQKELHPTMLSQWKNIDQAQIITPVFPNQDYLSGRACIEWYRTALPNHKVILIDSANQSQAERCQLFAYYKIPTLLDAVMKDKAQSWNPAYGHWRHMEKWELREALSFYIDQQSDLVDMARYATDNWLVVSPQSILDDLPGQVRCMLDFCGLTYNGDSIDAFYQKWLVKQQYILQEAETVELILRAIENNTIIEWQPLSTVGEAIVQSRLRRIGYKLDMPGLDVLPCDSNRLIACFLANRS